MSDIQSYAGITWSRSAEAAKRDASTQVYFVAGAGLIKIGFAISPIDRFFSMLTGCPVPLSLRASTPGGPTLENELHKRFAASRVHGEWFRPSPELDAVVAAAVTQYGPEFRDCVASRSRCAQPNRKKQTRTQRPRTSRYDWSPANPYSHDRPPQVPHPMQEQT